MQFQKTAKVDTPASRVTLSVVCRNIYLIYYVLLAESFVEHVVHLVPTELLAELLIVGVIVDDACFHVSNLGEVAPVLIGQCKAET